MKRTVVINVVGLTRSLLGDDTPNLSVLATRSANIKAVTPAVTCSAQATYLTGKLPRDHGIVGNGWYFKALGEIMFWRQSNRLIQGEKIWHAGRRKNPGFTCANLFWWYNMVTDVNWAVTPRPLYCADGQKLPDCYSIPAGLRDRFNDAWGKFPLFNFWGPNASLASSRWIANAAMEVEKQYQPTLHLIYLPHLDYALQKFGPNGPIQKDLRQIDSLCAELVDYFSRRRCRLIILSEYGITDVTRAVHPNRILQRNGYLAVKTDLEREYLDPGTCRALAVSDHQIAHIYIQHARDIPAVKTLFENSAGVERVLDRRDQKELGLEHERSGELVLLADSDAWFTYYFWEEDNRAPDYARTVNIHAKPGYDPCELFLDPAISFPKLKIGWTLAKKMLGFRYLLDVIPLDAGLVKGSHGRPTDDDNHGPILISSHPEFLTGDTISATAIHDLILNHIFNS